MIGRKGKRARPKKTKGAVAKAAAPRKRGKAKRTSSTTSRAKKGAVVTRARKGAKTRTRAKASGASRRPGVARKSVSRKGSATGTARRGSAKRVSGSAAKPAIAVKKPVTGASRPATPKAGASARKASVPKATVVPNRGAERGTVGRSTRTATPSARRISRPVPLGTARTVRSIRRTAVTLARPAGRPAPKGGIVIKGAPGPRYGDILTNDALAFVADLHRRFDATRKQLLQARVEQQARYDTGALPDFLKETRALRDGDWTVAPIPADLQDRRVEITGPVDRKMVINALNCGAKVYMADFEDANSPTWANNIEGQINLKDRWDGTLEFTDPASGKEYRVSDTPAVLIVRPRGWHLVEEHMTVDGEPVSGSLFDFGLYFFHNAKKQIAQGTGPYFYLPKLETHREARLWNDVFVYAQDKLGIPVGTIKATVLIETMPAAFEMDEILWELRDHIAGLNAGRWDYIFSFIKKFAKNPNYILPDRSQVVMGEAFLGAYAALLVRTCHLRGAFAMGGMAAQIPVRNNPAANEAAFAKVRADKEREVRDGYDGTWVAHPDLVPVAMEVFDRMMPEPNQTARLRLHVRVLPNDLMKIHAGSRSEEGFRLNVRVGVQYIEAWLRGRGAVPIYNLMEDAATAEISRAQIWQWIKYGVELDNGVKATPELFRRVLEEEMQRVKWEIGAEAYDSGRFPEAIKLFSDLSLAPEFEDFLTIPAYRLIA